MSKWTDTNLIPLAGLEYWHALDNATSGASVTDFSGNNRHIAAASSAPVLQQNIINGKNAIYFDGTKNPLKNVTDTLLLKHIFIIAAFDGASFAGNEGLLSDTEDLPVLIGNGAASVKFFDLNYDGVYRKNNTQYLESNQLAPINDSFALIELIFPDGLPFEGFQIGKDRDQADREWLGWFVEDMAYSRILTETERRRIFLYCAIKFALHNQGIPLYFPSDDLLETRRTRFYEEPLDFEKTTEFYEFEDLGRTFNEKTATPPRRWEYFYLGRTTQEVVIFDEFFNQARFANTFNFQDKYGILWKNVQIADYNRTHDAHKSWIIDCKFKLVKYPGQTASDEIAPVVVVTADALLGDITLLASVLDNTGIESVQFYKDGEALGEVLTSAPYDYVWESFGSENRNYVITARALDTSGNTGFSNELNLLLENDYTPPTVVFFAPAPNEEVSGAGVMLEVYAEDEGGSFIDRVEFYHESAPAVFDYIGDGNPGIAYAFELDSTLYDNGDATFAAIAFDNAGNQSTAATLTLDIQN